MNKIITVVNDLIKLTENEENDVKELEKLYQKHIDGKEPIHKLYDVIGNLMQQNLKKYNNIHIYPFETPTEMHSKVSRLVYKLRNVDTTNNEFIYYVQKAFELLFNFAYTSKTDKRIYKTVKTPVDVAVHKIPDIEDMIDNSVMCVMLRGALLPSMIMSKEIQEFSTTGYNTPFALFKINRDDTKFENNMEYILDLDRSFFNKENLDGKDLIFADPMNATAGSLISIVNFLKSENIKYKSIKIFNIITSYKGAIRVSKLDNVKLYSLWIDPVMDKRAYILPGLGDAGDRINGIDTTDNIRNIIQLIMDYGININSLYRTQIKTIERMILG